MLEILISEEKTTKALRHGTVEKSQLPLFPSRVSKSSPPKKHCAQTGHLPTTPVRMLRKLRQVKDLCEFKASLVYM